jgi:undecaprenyl-diphosphatase
VSGIGGSTFARVDQLEYRLCKFANAAAQRRVIRRFFRFVSRAGDGPMWVMLILSMPLWLGSAGYEVAVRMAVAGIVGLIIYKILKKFLVRERPYIGLVGIDCAMPPLDRYSFPSGHTLHAVMFATMTAHYLPEWSLLMGGFAVLVAASRVILGLHYPTDVIVGASIGYAIARTVVL